VASSWPWHFAYLSTVWIAMGNPILDFWSLAVEEQFYALWPFVIALTPRRWLPHVMVLTTIVLSLALKGVLEQLGVSQKAMQTLLFAKTPELGLGGLLALVCYRNGRPGDFSWLKGAKAHWFTGVALVCLAVDIAGWAVYRADGWFRFYLNDVLAGVFFTWLVAQCAIGLNGPVGMLMSHPAPQYVGRISYGLYLVHNWTPEMIERAFGPLPKLVAAPLVLGLTFAICALSWQFYEKPILGLKRFLSSTPKPFTAPPETARAVVAEAHAPAAAPASAPAAKAS
jgi:peptidoglycan/LPS O-acetylase OafA/YrhL